MSNRLVKEVSPYLLQHANNPVDWYSWGEEAFLKAKRNQKPIFLSVGYSTCHWCHVMERESFENADVADLLNRCFISIKVDREERPDVDRVYMTFLQATTGSGGWPMSVWLTPDLKPFFCGTYFPLRSGMNRPGFIEILKEIAGVWSKDADKVLQSANGLTERLRSTLERDNNEKSSVLINQVPRSEVLVSGVGELEQAFDSGYGGFGGPPKFPRPSDFLFLFREHIRNVNDSSRDMALETLRIMASSGMRDHINGGFHRYAVDRSWRVPHFEKMLYDQAQLVIAYLEAAQVSKDLFYMKVAEDTLSYVRREMTDRGGGFYSAEDADSVPPDDLSGSKSEGAFYIWKDSELVNLMGDEVDVVRLRFGVELAGNAPHDPQNEFSEKNILYVARSIEDIGRVTKRSPGQVADILNRACVLMREAREKRPRPHLDNKILSSWNGLMIAAFARAARVIGISSRSDSVEDQGNEFLEVAQAAAKFIHSELWDEEKGVLLRRYCDGQSSIDGYSEDYAFVIWGLLELFQVDADPFWLEWARCLQLRQDELFWDDAEGGWFSTTGYDPSVLLRLKDDYDGAEPSSNSVAVSNLLTLWHLTGDSKVSDKVERTFKCFGSRLSQAARSMPMMLSALSAYHSGVSQIVIVGKRKAKETQDMLAVIAEIYLPFTVTMIVQPGKQQARVAKIAPFIGSMTMRDGLTTAYVCQNFTCQEPITAIDQLKNLLLQR